MGRELVKSRTVGAKLVRALGLDPTDVWSVKLLIDAGDAVRVEVGRYITEDEFRHVCQVVDRYRLTDCAGLVWEDEVAP